MGEILTVAPPDPEFVLAATKWRVQRAEVDEAGTVAEGSRFFGDLRSALLYVHKAHLPFRMLNWKGEVVEEGKSLSVAVAKSWLPQEWRLTKPEVEDPLDPDLYPDRVATTETGPDSLGRPWSFQLWHRDASCSRVVQSKVSEEQPTSEECQSTMWSCGGCLPLRGDIESSTEVDAAVAAWMKEGR